MIVRPVSSAKSMRCRWRREAQFGAFVRQPLGVHPLADAGLAQRLRGAVLEHAGPDALLDVAAVAALEHHRVDALQVQQLREQQAGWAGADDGDLGPHAHLRRSVGLAPGCYADGRRVPGLSAERKAAAFMASADGRRPIGDGPGGVGALGRRQRPRPRDAVRHRRAAPACR